MLKKLELKNFKAFKKYTIKFNEFNLLIGQNNNGKSTIIDALRIIGIILSYKYYRNPVRIPGTKYNNEEVQGFYLPNEKIPFSLHNLRFDYNEKEDTEINAYFDDEVIVKINFPKNDNDNSCYFYFILFGINQSNSKRIQENIIDKLGVIPPLSKFDENEEILTETHVKKSYGTVLTPRHFRNIWIVMPEGFETYSKYISSTWPGIEVLKPELKPDKLSMFFKEDRITREISWAGSGLMIWMQLLTHITKFGEISTIILDEPDVYLHSDLQRKLITLLQELSSQIIISTHSVELINEVTPEEIIYIDKFLKSSKNLKDISEVQFYLNELGSAQNIQISKIIKSRKCLFVEGNDFKILKKIGKKLNKFFFYEGDKFSVVKLEGFSNSQRLLDSKWYFKNVIGEEIEIFVLLDSDFYSEKQLKKLKEKFKKNNLKHHIWKKKEIENYLLNVDVLYRVYELEAKRKNLKVMSQNEFIKILNSISNEFQNYTISRKLENEQKKKKWDGKKIEIYLDDFNKKWKDLNFRFNIISGKEFLTKLNAKMSNEYKITLTQGNIIRLMRNEEIPKELTQAIDSIIKSFDL